MTTFSDLTTADIAERSLAHLEAMVAIDSQSDETSDSIPTTDGQRALGDALSRVWAGFGATIERDAFANVIATIPGRGEGASAAPLALMVHMDTARGTLAVPRLERLSSWRGDRIPYPKNEALQVNTTHYPALEEFLGQDILFGPGDAPFGLDDKLGMAHLMTLAELLHEDPTLDHPPLLLIGRPDEEVGRMEAVEGIAELLAQRGVTLGYTVDGILPYEVNVENFNAAHAAVSFAPRTVELDEALTPVTVFIGGVNTHGATAKPEGYRAATRLGAELLLELERQGHTAIATAFTSDELRDCDATMTVATNEPDAVRTALASVVGPHVPLGASFKVNDRGAPVATLEGSTDAMLRFVGRFLTVPAPFVVPAEDSEGRQGYSAPFRAHTGSDGALLDIRVRDFDESGLAARKAHILEHVAASEGAEVKIHDQYVNMGPAIADRSELKAWAIRAGERVGVDVREVPIRGGTGVDPFVDRGVAIGNIGTGYFAPESEKELTSMQMLAGHARWLVALVGEAARG